jgi:N-ethylmaleimide reductase
MAGGFDGVEVHGANGYLLEQFVKDGANHRTDAYGGTVENRARLLLEVTAAVAKEIGPQRTGVRISPVSPANGISISDPQPQYNYIVEQLSALGIVYLHVIEGATGAARCRPVRLRRSAHTLQAHLHGQQRLHPRSGRSPAAARQAGPGRIRP